MPNRILKESITTSETIDQLSAEEERLFYRLLVVCDDYGRFDARINILIGRCFPLKIGSVTDKDIMAWLFGLSSAGLIRLYTVDGRPYLQVVTWDRHQQMRAKRSRYPQAPADEGENGARGAKLREYPPGVSAKDSRGPASDSEPLLAGEINPNQAPADFNSAQLATIADDSECSQSLANVPVFVFENPNPNPNPNPRVTGANAPVSFTETAQISEVFDHFQRRIKAGVRLTKSARAKIRTRLREFTAEQLMCSINNFADDWWYMEKCRDEPVAWFFASEDRIDKFLNMRPRPTGGQTNGHATGADRLGDHQGQPDRSVPPTGDYGLEERITF